ncbi:hypothetical protein PTSG_05386 [Salpingoeca rosetta]|uniref:Galactose oxidase n=1 Tax=Salpingoeca rosetta (strain ATCC 50818 / BSB-021) TaxID=946362 RepID=F2UA98_SALR5|nr:uncharacterized protein PTSG_05386 [Salpingoeca rosetta]EGD73673.1 hypothetical protein PTSG_05386 [Salpingoeca rosetta]|eukprot:XP_004993954.1 hypothetical protein PTSG_05386 [Salpingoeca rosetta]
MALRVEWKPVSGNGPRERSAHACAVDEASGRFVLHGGVTVNADGDPIPNGDVWVLKNLDSAPQWEPVRAKGDVPCKREGHTLTYVPAKNMFVLFAGSDGALEKEFNDVYTLDESLTWKRVETKGVPPAPRLNHAADVVDDALYVFGGFEDGQAKNDMFKLDLNTMMWTPVHANNPPSRRCNHSMTAVGSKLYVFGGRGGEATLYNDLFCFDTESRAWTAVKAGGQPPTARDFHSAATFGDKVFVFGGSMEIESKDIFTYYNDVVVFDTTRQAWVRPQVSGAVPSVRWAHAAAVYKNKMIVFGGTANDVDLSDTHILTITDATVKPAAPRRKPSVGPPAKPKPAPKQEAQYERTTPPDITYDVPNPAPALRRRVTPKAITDVAPRDFERVQSQMIQSIEDLFRKIKGEYQQIDRLRAELISDREAFEKEKAENEALFESQQQSMQHLQETHRRETEAWLAARRKENDDERRKIAEEWARVKKEEERLKGVETQLKSDRNALETEKTDFEKRRKKMEAIMAQFEGLNS